MSERAQHDEQGYDSLFDVVAEGEFYKQGSSYPWRGGTHTAVVAADSPAEAIIEVLEGLGNHGRIESEGGDTEWTVFDSERELVFRVSPVPDATKDGRS